ncbi:WD40 repeat domain-containing protein [Candidatus Marithrix sp. Canyon 246]|uniref:WD40 repeat domain-containing protein n=1 Tax=Candidatus Marithrix sp. Canyon 246 TaxID=1827136 RepID=UPI00084A11FA|nr:tetratricopeptide repeat protein [Candidatus Marithrix sp. Canyon 246]
MSISLKHFAIILILSFSNNSWADCSDAAIDFVYQFYDVHSQAGSIYRQKALQLCPTMPEAHNNLASLLEDEASYSQAIFHYKQAIQQRPNFPQAWYGLGETYYKQGRFALSLEAHLHACQDDKDSLLALYDPQRRQAMNQLNHTHWLLEVYMAKLFKFMVIPILKLLKLLSLTGCNEPENKPPPTSEQTETISFRAPPILQIDTGGHKSKINDVRFTSDGRYLVSAADDKLVRIWDLETGETVRTLRGHNNSKRTY